MHKNQNMNLHDFKQTGGIIGGIFGALMSFLNAILRLFIFIGKVLKFFVVLFGPSIIKFIILCIIVSLGLCLFGFFGIFMTFLAIVLIYYKLYHRIQEGDMVFARELHKKGSSSTPEQQTPKTVENNL